MKRTWTLLHCIPCGMFLELCTLPQSKFISPIMSERSHLTQLMLNFQMVTYSVIIAILKGLYFIEGMETMLSLKSCAPLFPNLGLCLS